MSSFIPNDTSIKSRLYLKRQTICKTKIQSHTQSPSAISGCKNCFVILYFTHMGVHVFYLSSDSMRVIQILMPCFKKIALKLPVRKSSDSVRVIQTLVPFFIALKFQSGNQIFYSHEKMFMCFTFNNGRCLYAGVKDK